MEFDTSGNSKAFLHDPLGNVLNTTTEDGRAQKPLFYDGYGLPVWPDEEESRVRRQPFQYKGQFGYYTDVHTGLSYCHNRYYDPRMGRWLSRDPIGLAGGTNVYSYCAGDPVNLVDPDGLQVRAPGPWEELIPIWGPGRDAVNEFQAGKVGWGIFHSIVAISDVFLVRSVVTGAGKGLYKLGAAGIGSITKKQGVVQGAKTVASKAGIWKSGSNSWGATRKWLGKSGWAAPGQPVHHWIIAQNSPIGKFFPNWVKNQKWNLKAIKGYKGFDPHTVHRAIHGRSQDLMLHPIERLLLGTPAWSKAFAVSGSGRLLD